MRVFKKVIKATVAVCLLSGSASYAEVSQGAYMVKFSGEENGGSRDVVRSLFGDRPMETAVIDINDDKVAEIAVRFLDQCSGGRCKTEILYNRDGEWLSILDTQASYLVVESQSSDGLKNLKTDEYVTWTWVNREYWPMVTGVKWLPEIATPSFVLTERELQDPVIQFMHEAYRYEIDLTGDGKIDSVIYSNNIQDCNGFGGCPVVIHDHDGRQIGNFFSTEGRVGIGDGKIMVINRDGFSIFAFDGQYFSKEDTYVHSQVRHAQ